MQRIAALVLCAALWGSSASAQTCATIGNIVGGFAGGASGYGMVRYAGPAASWVAAGLYGAGMTVGGLGAARAFRDVCESIEAIMKVTAEIYCFAGEFMCESIQDVARSMARDFQLCSECTPDEVIGAFPLRDAEREQHLSDMQNRRGAQSSGLAVLPRDTLISVEPSTVDYYHAGLQAAFRLQRELAWRERTNR